MTQIIPIKAILAPELVQLKLPVRIIPLHHKTVEVQMTFVEAFHPMLTRNPETTAPLVVVLAMKFTRLSMTARIINHEARRTLTIWLMDLMQNIVIEIAVIRTVVAVTIMRVAERDGRQDLLCEAILLL
jgi:hypothetical protein